MVAVPGGSVLKMLSGLASEPSASAIDWKKVLIRGCMPRPATQLERAVVTAGAFALNLLSIALTWLRLQITPIPLLIR